MTTELSVIESQEVKVINESVSFKPAADSFKQGWQEAMTGRVKPVEELWDGID